MTTTTPQLAPGKVRALATIETITELAPIPDADAIVRARIRGWDVVVKLGEFAVGDPCVYFEVDTLLEVADPRFEFLAARGVRTDSDGVYGHVLRTARLRGQYSQGLALPLSAFPELDGFAVGDDVTAQLPVIKWEPPIPQDFAGQIRGFLPAWISTTDEERVQNLADILAVGDDTWIATEKVDGRSSTFYVEAGANDDGTDRWGACSRTLDFLPSDTNSIWRMGQQLRIWELATREYPGQNVAIQGELYGEGIQGNRLGRRGHHFAVFNLRVGQQDVPRSQWPTWLLELSVPVHALTFPSTVDEALAQVEHLKSVIDPKRTAEGIVWRAPDEPFVTLPTGALVRASFKVVSNRYLLKGSD